MDEAVHVAASQLLLRLLKKEDPDFQKISEELHDKVQSMFMEAIKEEEEWADYLFKDGSIIGLNAEILKQYIQWLGSRRMTSVGVKCPYKTSKANPLPWIDRWLTNGDTQVAPQETEKSDYLIGGIDGNISTDKLKGLDLD